MHLALKHNQLTSERGILSLKSADRSERRNQQPQKEEEQRDYRGRRYAIPSSDQTDEVFGTHRGVLLRWPLLSASISSPLSTWSPDRMIGYGGCDRGRPSSSDKRQTIGVLMDHRRGPRG